MGITVAADCGETQGNNSYIGQYQEDSPLYARPQNAIHEYSHLRNKDKAIEEAKAYKGATVYVDSSARNGLVRIGGYWQGIQGWGPMSHTIANNSKHTKGAGKLAAIEAVIVKIWFHTEQKQL